MDPAELSRIQLQTALESLHLADASEVRAKLRAFLESPSDSWDQEFWDSIDTHKDETLLGGKFGPYSAFLVCAESRVGYWAGQLDGLKGKGILPESMLNPILAEATKKGLVKSS